MERTQNTQTQNTQSNPEPKFFEVCVRAGWDWCYQVKPENLKRTLKKLLKKHGKDIVVWIMKGYYWYRIDGNDLENFIEGNDIDTVFHAEHPFFSGCKAYGYVTLNINEFLEVDQ